MEPLDIRAVGSADVQSPVLIEGLPGTGLIGTLCANHLVDELQAKPVRRIYSEYFHPIVTVDEKSVATLDPLTIYSVNTNGTDLLVLAGRIQAEDSVGQYRLTEVLLEIAEEFDVAEVISIGGAVMGEPVENPKVVGSVASGCSQLKSRLKNADVAFNPEIPMSIGGVSGLLLGLAPDHGLPAASLLGTTQGYRIDPKCAREVLDVLQRIYGFSVDLSPFTERPDEKKKSVRKTQKILQMTIHERDDSGESLRYLG